jgi:hypothetical protein
MFGRSDVTANQSVMPEAGSQLCGEKKLCAKEKLMLTWIGVIFALLAAVLWGWSALVNLPVIGSAYGTIANLEPFYAAMKKIARLNGSAAACAFISSVAQAIAMHGPLH